MNLSSLVKTKKRTKKRVGRGIGSGRGGHTSGRGTKGQRSRGKIPLLFEGAASGASLIKRLPLLRGKGKHKSHQKRPIAVNLKYLNLLPPNSKVDLPTLIKHKIVAEKEAKMYGVKILGEGELKIPLTITLPHSKSVAKKVEAFSKKSLNEKPKETAAKKIKTKKAVKRSKKIKDSA